MPVILREGLKQASQKKGTDNLGENTRRSETPPFPSNQGLENSASWQSRGFILLFRGMRVRLLFHFILSPPSPPPPLPGLTINQPHLGYVYSITDSFTGLKKIIEFQLVV